ncbi:glycosyltransferase family protein [Piscinibacter terrae]|nr:hypothetical protein [Albitalea terrae]
MRIAWVLLAEITQLWSGLTMSSIALFALAGTSLALALHAFVTYPLSLYLLRRWQRAAQVPVKWLRPVPATRHALCLYATEATGLPRPMLDQLRTLRQRYPRLQMLLCADGELPALAEAGEALAACRVEVCATPMVRGKSHAMNLLARRTPADVLVFANAGVALDAQLIDKLEAHFADREIGCVCATLEAAPGDGALLGYRRIDAWIRALESDTGSTVGANGSLFAVRAALYHPAPDHALHDMYVSLMVLCGGHRVVCAGDLRVQPVPAGRGATFRLRRDMAYNALCVHRLMWSMLARLDALTLYKYVSHKLLRWFSGYLVAVALGSVVIGQALSGHFMPAAVLASGVALVWVLGEQLRLPPFAQAFDALSALGGTGLGAAHALLHPR